MLEALLLSMMLVANTPLQATPADLEFTYEDCVAGLAEGYSVDRDLDGFADRCELLLAQQFHPVLRYYDNETKETSSLRMFWAARPEATNEVLIFYATAYFRDWGDGVFHISQHDGDSEFIFVRVEYRDNQGWQVISDNGIFLSAHFNPRSDVESQFHNRNEFRFVNSHPIVHVAEWKHANYPSTRSCERGGFGQSDRCRNHRFTKSFYVDQYNNLGSVTNPFIQEPVLLDGAQEHWGFEEEWFWEDEIFCGWQRAPDERPECTFIDLARRRDCCAPRGNTYLRELLFAGFTRAVGHCQDCAEERCDEQGQSLTCTSLSRDMNRCLRTCTQHSDCPGGWSCQEGVCMARDYRCYEGERWSFVCNEPANRIPCPTNSQCNNGRCEQCLHNRLPRRGFVHLPNEGDQLYFLNEQGYLHLVPDTCHDFLPEAEVHCISERLFNRLPQATAFCTDNSFVEFNGTLYRLEGGYLKAFCGSWSADELEERYNISLGQILSVNENFITSFPVDQGNGIWRREEGPPVCGEADIECGVVNDPHGGVCFNELTCPACPEPLDACQGNTCVQVIFCPDDCGGHGECLSTGECQCNEGYTGSACNQCVPGYRGYPNCQPSPPECFASHVQSDLSTTYAFAHSIAATDEGFMVCWLWQDEEVVCQRFSRLGQPLSGGARHVFEDPARRLWGGPTVASSGDGFGVVFSEEQSSGEQILKFWPLNAQGQPLSEPVVIPSVRNSTYTPQIIWADDAYVVAWKDRREESMQIYVTRIDSDGTVLSEQQVSNTTRSVDWPLLAYSGDTLGVGWIENNFFNDKEIHFQRLETDLTPTGSSVLVTNAGRVRQQPILVWFHDTFTFIWGAKRGNNPRTIYWRHISADGEFLIDEQLLVEGREPRLAATEDAYTFVWWDRDEDITLFKADLSREGQLLEEPFPLVYEASPTSISTEVFALSRSSDTHLLVWTKSQEIANNRFINQFNIGYGQLNCEP